MAFTSAINILQTLVCCNRELVWQFLGELSISWEGYGNDNPRSQVTGNQAAYGRWRCRSDRYTACTITGEFVLAGGSRKGEHAWIRFLSP